MAATCPFSVDRNEFQGKRVLVTGGTKGLERPWSQVVNGRRFCRHHCAFTSSRSQQPALFINTDIATARGVQEVEDKLS